MCLNGRGVVRFHNLNATIALPFFVFLLWFILLLSMANSDFDFVKNVGLREYERERGIFVIASNENLGKIKRAGGYVYCNK